MRKQLKNVGFVKQALTLVQEYENQLTCDDCGLAGSDREQFFICFDDARFLDRQYTVWGQVTSGMENVDKIKRGEPVRDPDKIVSAKLS
jgi:cyclophilin family peptidyl-prolyl cis-trans isomerase